MIHSHLPASRVVLSALCLSILNQCWSQIPQVDWASVFYGVNPPNSIDCAVDVNGNVYVLGEFSGAADFDPGPSVYPLYSNDGNIFVTKLNAQGALLWAKQFGGLTAYAAAIETDQVGGVYITGNFFDTSVDFDPGPNFQTLAGFGGFLVKLSSSGSFVWARQLGGPIMIVRDMAIDSLGNPVVTGNFQGTVDFDPGIGELDITSAGSDDAFVVKYTSFGELLWAATIGGPSIEDGLSLASDGAGNTYVGGTFFDSCDFDPGPSSYVLSSNGGGDAFVCKLGPQGGLVWSVAMGGPATNFAAGTQALTISNGQVIAAGHFTGSADFDPTGDTAILTSAGGVDVFVSRLTLDGLFNGVHQIGGWEGNEYCQRVIVNAAGDIILSFTAPGTVDLDPGVGEALFPGGRYVCCWTFSAEFLWAFSGTATAVVASGADELYCIGSCWAGDDVDPSSSVYEVSQTGALTMKLDQLSTKVRAPIHQNTALVARPLEGADHSWLITFPSAPIEGEVRVMDSTGKVLFVERIGSGRVSHTIDLGGFSSGTYIVVLVQGEHRGAVRVVR